jgi:hypothetical protein
MCAVEAQGGTVVQLHASLTSVLARGEGGFQLVMPTPLPLEKEPLGLLAFVMLCYNV